MIGSWGSHCPDTTPGVGTTPVIEDRRAHKAVPLHVVVSFGLNTYQLKATAEPQGPAELALESGVLLSGAGGGAGAGHKCVSRKHCDSW